MNNGSSPLKDSVEEYYQQENKRRAEWLNETMRTLVPKDLMEALDKSDAGSAMKAQQWLKDNGYRMEISPDNILIQLWKDNEQIAQYQTILPKVVEFIDGNPPQSVQSN